MVINVAKGNVFDLDPNGFMFVHCMSEDLKMGKGIGLELRHKFNLGEKLRKIRNIKVGDAIFTDNVCNLITRKRIWDVSNYEDFRKSLENMKQKCLDNNITKLAIVKFIPEIDGLDWSKSKHIMETVFENTNVEIQVRY